MFELRGSHPIAQGHKRFVFQHASEPDLLIKVWQPDVVKQRWDGQAWYKRTRYRQYISVQREISEQLALGVRFPAGVPVLQTISGLVNTDYGIGVVVEKITDRDGQLAPSLIALLRRDGITAKIVDRLKQFQDELLHYGVIVGKLHDRNLVLGVRAGEERFIMVDGYGEKTFIPIHSWSRRANASHTRQRMAALIRTMELQFGVGRNSPSL